MDFAKNQLEKHGWKAGQGLGKDEHGIKEAIKVKIKKDVTGVGHDPGEEFTFHWWDHVFNKAANNLNVENSEGGVQVKNVSEVNVSRKKPLGKVLDNKAMLYGRFVKAATLDNGLETPQASDSSSDSDDDDDGVHTSLNHLTDEELLKICGGRTAHKGARHGIKMNGKLARIEQQEMMIIAAQSDSCRSSPVPDINDSIVKKKKKKRKAEEPGEQDSIEVIHKEKKKKKNKAEVTDFDNEHKKEIDNDKKEKKKNRKHNDESAEKSCIENIENKMANSKKKKKSEERGTPDDTIEENVNNNDPEDKDSTSAKKKKKKSKSKRDVVSSSDSVVKTDSDDNGVSVKKSKKHKKKKSNRD